MVLWDGVGTRREVGIRIEICAYSFFSFYIYRSFLIYIYEHRYKAVKDHPWSRSKAKARHQKEREQRDEYGATVREKRRAKNRARKMKKNGRPSRRWVDC